MHIAILNTDVPVPAVYSKRGLYSTQFHNLLQAAARRLVATQHIPENSYIHTSAYDVVGGIFPPCDRLRRSPPANSAATNGTTHDQQYPGHHDPGRDVIDGILITGSAASAYDTEKNPWIPPLIEFIRDVWTYFPAVKIFGSCFGHQVIAAALLSGAAASLSESEGKSKKIVNGDAERERGNKGDIIAEACRVERCPSGYEIGIVPISLNPAFARAIPYLGRQMDGRGVLRLQLVHGDRVVPVTPSPSQSTSPDQQQQQQQQTGLPNPWSNLGHTPQCPVHGLYYPNRVLTYQGHFEFDTFVNAESITEFGKRFGWNHSAIQEYVDKIRSSAATGEGKVEGQEDDSKLAAEVLVLFFAGRAGLH